MNKIFLCFLAIAVFSCARDNSYQPSEKERSADAIMAKTAAKLCREFDLIPCGTGGQMLEQIKMLALCFDYKKPLTIEQGRKLLLQAIQEFILSVNTDESIKPYIHSYPFEYKNVVINIFIQKADRSSVDLGELCIVSANRGILKYDIRDPNTQRLRTIHSETYEEALQRVCRLSASSPEAMNE